MPAVNFKARFALKVLHRQKRTTIRAGERFKVGNRFLAFFGMRTKWCVPLAEGVVLSADAVTIEAHGITVLGRFYPATSLVMEGIALGDGFKSPVEFIKFFADTYGLPFTGQLIGWEPEILPDREMQRREMKLAGAFVGITSGGGLKKASRKKTAARSPKKKGVKA